MNTGFKRAAALGLCACLGVASLAGCTKEAEFDAEATAITINGEEISAGLVSFSVHFIQAVTESMYDSYFGDGSFQMDMGSGSTIGDMVRSSAISTLEEMVLARQNMDDYDVSLTDEELSAIEEAASVFMDTNDDEVLEKMSATQEIVEEYLQLYTIESKMETAMGADVDTEVSDEEAAQRRVRYVYFPKETEAETEEETGTEEESSSEEESALTEAETGTEAETAASAETDSENVTETASGETETAALADNEAETTKSSGETETEAAETAADETEADETEAAETAADETEAAETAADETEAAETEADGTESDTDAETETETETETEDPETAAAMAKAYDKAMQMITLVQSGEDFDDAAAAVDDTVSPYETTFGSDSTSIADALIEATEGVGDDTLITEPVKGTSGYYVVKVISELDREATDEKKEEIVEERRSDQVEELFTEWKDNGEITEDDDVLDLIVYDFSLEEYVESELSTEAESESETEVLSEAESAAVEAAAEAAETETEAVTEAAETETEAAAAEAAETETEAAETEAAETETAAAAAEAAETETEAPETEAAETETAAATAETETEAATEAAETETAETETEK